MKNPATHLLLIESDPADAKVIKDALHDDSAAFVVEWVKSLAEALEYLANNPIEVVLLDLALPDGKGLDAFDKVIEFKPKDQLEIVINNLAEDSIERMTFCFKYKGGKWVAEEYDTFELMNRYDELAFGNFEKIEAV